MVALPRQLMRGVQVDVFAAPALALFGEACVVAKSTPPPASHGAEVDISGLWCWGHLAARARRPRSIAASSTALNT